MGDKTASAQVKQTEKKLFAGKAGPGRPKGVPNKSTTLLKDAILEAATAAGDKAGLVGYLTTQARDNPQSFLPLLGKVLPLQLTGEDGGAIRTVNEVFIRGVEPIVHGVTT